MRHLRSAVAGYTLLELVVTIVALATVFAAVAPAVGSLRGEGMNLQSRANLMALGQGRDQYALDNQDRIYTYTWRAGETYVFPNGLDATPNTDELAAAMQNQEILMRRTGRISGSGKILLSSTELAHRRMTHLVLMDYMAGEDDESFVSEVFVDPADGDLLNWQQEPLGYLDYSSSVPYTAQTLQGYHQSFSWTLLAIRQRWAFSTSYQSVPFAWQGDGPTNVYGPVAGTPHAFAAHGTPDLSGRSMPEVAFPSGKVHLYEEFDREQKRFPWFAYGHAKPEKLMFDGSINSERSHRSNSAADPSGWNPGVWRQRYVPLDTFPIPLGGFEDDRELDMRYQWTDGGLQGIDYD